MFCFASDSISILVLLGFSSSACLLALSELANESDKLVIGSFIDASISILISFCYWIISIKHRTGISPTIWLGYIQFKCEH